MPNYADAMEALRLQTAVPVLMGREEAYQAALPSQPLVRAMWSRDDPAHADLRRMSERDFRPEAIAPIIASTRKLAEALLSGKTQQEPTGRMELVEEYAVPLAREAVCKGLVGIDPAQEDWLCAWQNTHPSVFLQDEAVFVADVQAWLAQRAAQPGKKMIDNLIALYHQKAPVGGSPMSLDDLVSYFDMLAVGAYESLRTNIATALVLLIEHDALPELRAQQGQDTFPALCASATEEVLRLAPSFPCIYLSTRAEVRLGRQHIPAGAMLMIWLSAANRDPAVFKDPDRFDLWRYFERRLAPRPPLTFGYGMHHCLGALLSRQVIEASIEAFVAHVRGTVRLDPQEAVTWYPYYGSDHSLEQASVLYEEHES